MKRFSIFVALTFISFNVFPQADQQKMDELLTAYNRQNKFNGTVLVGKKDEILFEKAYGYQDVGKQIPNDINGIFEIASITKQFTAATIMQLQEEGKLSVKDNLNKYYPNYLDGNKITIEELLTHTSGIYNYGNDTVLSKADPTQHVTEAQMLATFMDRPLDFEPGTKFNYSNSAYSLLGYLIEKITKKPYEQVVRERIFQPLGMTHSGFDFTNLRDIHKTKGYAFLSGSKAVPVPIVDSTISFSAGGIYSTVEDLYKWERAIGFNIILKPESWKKVFTPHLNKYGYGWVIDSVYGKLFMSHSGITLGFTSDLIRFPKDELTVIILDNASSHFTERIAQDLAAIVYHQPYDLPDEKKEIGLSAEILQHYVGVYQGDNGIVGTITIEGNHLKQHPTGESDVQLYPEKENFFFAKGYDAKVEFVKDANGKVIEQIIRRNNLELHFKKIK